MFEAECFGDEVEYLIFGVRIRWLHGRVSCKVNGVMDVTGVQREIELVSPYQI